MNCDPEYVVGKTRKFAQEFRIVHELTDPDTVRFIVEKPDGSKTVLVFGVDAELKRASLGKFFIDLLLDLAGTWKWRWEATLAGFGWADQGSFYVAAADPVG